MPPAAATQIPATANKPVQKRERISQTPKAPAPLPFFATPSTVAPTPAAAPSPPPFSPAPASPAVETPTKSKRKAEKQFDKDDPFGQLAEAASIKKTQGSSTSNLFKSIVGKNPMTNGTAPPTPERKILTPKKIAASTTPKTNPFGSLPAASSPAKQDSAAPTPKANTFASLGGTAKQDFAAPTSKANTFGSLPAASSPAKQDSAAPTPKAKPFAGLATPTKASTPAKSTEQPKANPFANLPKSPTKAETPVAAPAAAAQKNPFQVKTNTADAPKSSQSFQFKSAITTAAPVIGGFKPTVAMSFDSGDAFAKKAAAAKKKAANDAMERAKDEDWDEDEEEEEWEIKYWIRKADEDKKHAEKAKNTTLAIPKFGAIARVPVPAASKPADEAKDTSRSGTASPKSVLDNHGYGSGKTGGAVKNPFAHLSAATSPASSGKNDADDEDAEDDAAAAVKPGTGGSLFDRVSRPNSPAPSNLLGSVSKSSAADQTFKHDSPLRFARSTATSSTIFGAPAPSAPSIFGSAAPSDAGTPKPNAFAGLFGSKPASGTTTPSGAPKSSGFSFGANPAGTETPTASGSIFAQNEKKSETPIPPPKPFSFLKNPAASGIAGSTANTSRASTPGLTTEGENTDAGAESAEVDPEHVHEQLKDLATQPEAGEETLWMHKAKASQLKDGKWQQGIVGVFKVLTNKETGKYRYIMRLDNGSVRMNESMIHTEPKATGKNVRMVLPSGIWAMTVKTPDVASELVKVVDKAVKDL